MVKPLPIVGQIVVYALFAWMLGYFSVNPAYTYLDPDKALIKLSFSHAGQIKGECRPLTTKKIANLPPTSRQLLECPRERFPVLIELEFDGAVLYSGLHQPSGLWKDGTSSVYRRFPVAAGRYRLLARLRDSDRTEGFDYQDAVDIELSPRQNFVVDFRVDTGGFIFR